MADVLVVLGCRVWPSGRPAGAAYRRARAAAAAFHRGLAPRVIVSGGRRWGVEVEARALRRMLVSLGVPERAISEELCSLSTRENALFVARHLRPRGELRVGVVTCPWHMARAVASFHRVGLATVSVPAEAPSDGPLPRARRWVHEWVCGWLDGAVAGRSAPSLGRPS